ncbi:hypothetical protein ACA910_017801 [Epithemia clementina (nom. ined.)]
MSVQRRSGASVVGVVVAVTLAAVGVGTIYLPFIADRDKLRGLNEDSDKEYEKMLKAQLKEMKANQLKQQPMEGDAAAAADKPDVAKTHNSMWQALSRGSKK